MKPLNDMSYILALKSMINVSLGAELSLSLSTSLEQIIAAEHVYILELSSIEHISH